MVRVEKKGAGAELVSGVHEKAFPFHFCQFDVQNRDFVGGGPVLLMPTTMVRLVEKY